VCVCAMRKRNAIHFHAVLPAGVSARVCVQCASAMQSISMRSLLRGVSEGVCVQCASAMQSIFMRSLLRGTDNERRATIHVLRRL